MPLKYDPGNLGDILKHCWLIEIIDWLSGKKEGIFRYADSFCGCFEYEVISAQVSRRFSEILKDTRLFRLQHQWLRRGAYLGSAALAQKVLKEKGIASKISVFDREAERVRTYLVRGEFERMPIDDGYSVLQLAEPFDLIHLDPYDDFVPSFAVHLPHILSRRESASILIFIIYRAGQPGEFREFLSRMARESEAHPALLGLIPAHPYDERESKYHSGMLLLPEKSLAAEAELELFPLLESLTKDLNRRICENVCVAEW